MSDDLERANASIRTGARLSQVGIPIFAALALLVLANTALGPWLDGVGRVMLVAVVLITIAATTAIVVGARRLGRFQLSVEGVHAPDGSTLSWNAITRATNVKGWLSLYDGAGRAVEIPIMFAAFQARVLAAIRARLPAGVQIDDAQAP